MLHTQTISLNNQRTHMMSDIHGNLKLFKKTARYITLFR